MPMAEHLQRMNIKVSKEVHAALKEESHQMGITTTALVAYILGRYVQQKQQVEPKFIEALGKDIGKLIAEATNQEMTLKEAFQRSNEREGEKK